MTPIMLGKRSSRLSRGNSSIANAIALKQRRDMLTQIARKPKNSNAEKKKGPKRQCNNTWRKKLIKEDEDVLGDNKTHISQVMCNVDVPKEISEAKPKQQDPIISNVSPLNTKSLLSSKCSNKLHSNKPMSPSNPGTRHNLVRNQIQ